MFVKLTRSAGHTYAQIVESFRDANGQPVPRGSYQLVVAATTADGRSIDVTQDVTGTVTRVSFERGYPELFLDTGSAAPISDLVSVADRPRTP